MKIHTLTIAILFLWSSLIIAQEKLKFSTQQTRELWQVCAVSFRNINPSIGQDIYFPTCDCYVDHIRANYDPEVMEKMTQTESSKLAQELRNKCNPKKSNEENFT